MPDAAFLPARTGPGEPREAKDQIVLGFDFGTRRIGVAVGNGVTQHARPLALIADEGEVRWRRIAELIAAWQPARLVVGVPRHPDGAAHELSARCERFARQLEGRFRLPVARVDERYSSAVVEEGRDDEAAAVILQQWLDMSVREAPGKFPSTSRGGGSGGNGV
jgi:putative Holliday junction resolvase